MQSRGEWMLASALILLVAIAGIGFVRGSQDNAEGGSISQSTPETSTATITPTMMPTEVATPTPIPTPTPEPVATLTAEQLAEYRPNELGQIMVLQYHGIDQTGDAYATTPEKFRAHLQWLYDNNFYVIPTRDLVHNTISAPAGKRPVTLTFDDGLASQFRYIVDSAGNKTIDPDCGVGILEEYFTKYPDFGRGGLFSILPLAPFAWPDADDQRPYGAEKVQWMIDHGYEIGNHTVGHVNMREISEEELKEELAGAVDMVQELAPEAQVEIIAVPFGVYPPGGDTSVFEGFDYHGKHYAHSAALMVGSNPAPSPVHVEFDPMWLPRIQAIDEETDKWFSYVEENPGIMYVSDGNPDTITIPNDLHPYLVGTFDESRADGKTIIRY